MQPEKSLTEVPSQPYFRLLVHGTYGGDIIAIKITSESNTLEGGSSLLEGLDRLVKLFWIFNIQYTGGCENFFRLIHTAIYKLNDGPVPNSLLELISILSKYI